MANQGQVTNYFAMSTNTTPATEEQNHTFATIGVTGGNSEAKYYCTADISFNFLSPEEGTDLKENINAGDLKAKFKTEDNNATVSGLSSEIDLYNYKNGYQKTINITLTGDGANTKIQGDIYLVNKEEEQNYMANAKLEAEITVTNLKCSTIEPEVKIEPKLCSSNLDSLTIGDHFSDGTYTYIYGQNYRLIDSLYEIYDFENMRNTDAWSVMTNSAYKYTGSGEEENTESITEPPCTMIDDKPVISMTYMFYNTKVDTIDISKMYTENVTNMERIFMKTQANEVILPKNFGSNETSANSMFYKAIINNINLKDMDTSNITDMSLMFCESQISNLDVSTFNTAKVTDMSLMFDSLNTDRIILSKNFGSAAINMNNMFNETTATAINLENMNTSSATNMSLMFASAEIPKIDLSSFDTSQVTKMNDMFNRAQANEIILSKNFGSAATNMSSMFNSSQIEEINLTNMNTSRAMSGDGMFLSASIPKIDLSSFDTSHMDRMWKMFASVKTDQIILSKNFGSAATNMNQMFSGVNISSLDLSNLDLTSIEVDNGYVGSTGQMFDGCTANPIYVSSQWLSTFQQINQDMNFEVKEN